MKKIICAFLCGVLPIIVGCDLQPKITALPDTVGEFITTRYPALLADPNSQPEIYNSAAADYGVYASPQLYGTAPAGDYVTYASVNDYIVPPTVADENVAALYGEPIAQSDAPGTDKTLVPEQTTVATSDDAPSDDFLTVPEYHRANSVTEKRSDIAPAVATTTRVQLQDITVAPGDTLYSLSRRYSVPVNDLAVMNNISAPFTLSVGQRLRVPNLASAPVRASVATTTPKVTPVAATTTKAASVAVTTTATRVTTTPSATKTSPKQVATVTKAKQKISSDPNKKLPTIAARSSSKFSWPVRGKILSHYGAKSGGLFNDGINISAARGSAVRAAENGVVAYAGNEVKGMGNLVIIQHSGGWMTVYAHMDTMAVRRGARVSVGQKIGTVGATGKVDKPQLHFEIRKGTKAYNPSSYLRS